MVRCIHSSRSPAEKRNTSQRLLLDRRYGVLTCTVEPHEPHVTVLGRHPFASYRRCISRHLIVVGTAAMACGRGLSITRQDTTYQARKLTNIYLQHHRYYLSDRADCHTTTASTPYKLSLPLYSNRIQHISCRLSLSKLAPLKTTVPNHDIPVPRHHEEMSR